MRVLNFGSVLAGAALTVFAYATWSPEGVAEGPSAFRSVAYNDPIRGLYGPVLTLSPGTYDHRNLDATAVTEWVVKQFDQVRREDKALITNSINSLNARYESLLQAVYGPKGLVGLSNNSTLDPLNPAGKPTPREFAKIKTDFDGLLSVVRNEVATVGMLASLLKDASYEPNATEVKLNEIKKNLDGIDFSLLQGHYERQLKELLGEVEKLDFRIKLPVEGVYYAQKGIADLSGLRRQKLYSPDELKKLRHDMLQYQAKNAALQNTVNKAMHLPMLKIMNTVIQQFGEKEKYRVRLNQPGMEDAIKRIEDLFFVRSYIRALYGVSLGSFKVRYDKKSFNRDLLSGVEIDSGSDSTVRSLDELTVTQDNVVSALRNMQIKDLNVDEIFGKGHNLVSRVASAITILRGNGQTVHIKALLLPFILNDIQEELMLAGSEGADGVKALYKRRYRTQTEPRWAQARDAYFPQNPTADSMRADITSIKGITNFVVNAVLDKMTDLSAAADIAAQVKAFQMDDQFFKQFDDRSRDM